MANDTKGVFISYRRDESAGYAGRIADSFGAHFGEDKVFRDLDSLEPGLDFAEAIERAIESSEVLIAVIGKNWLTATDSAGQKRLENPDDYVRTEITTALERNIRVIPLLIQGAAMPSARELPDDLALLSRRNAFEIHDSSWKDDIRRLVTTLERVIKVNRPATPDEPGAVKQTEVEHTESTRTAERAQDSALQAFLDQISHSDTYRALRTAPASGHKRAIQRAKLQSLLLPLDEKRKGVLLSFLHEAKLIRKKLGRQSLLE